MRFGHCCIFAAEPIKFRTTTATALLKLPRESQIARVGELALANANSLWAAFEFCLANGIGAFRVNSQILPLKTHPSCGYDLAELPDEALDRFKECGKLARANNLRVTFHPDQFVVLSSPREEVVASSLAEIEYQAELSEMIGGDVINIHGGGAYGNKAEALTTFARSADRLSDRARTRLTVENDDKVYTPNDLIPLCRITGIPFCYDVHHHRCLSDELSVGEATSLALQTWDREPLFHISSPKDGWQGPKPERHHDYIDPADFPEGWRELEITVDVEAKAKELAVLRLMKALGIANH